MIVANTAAALFVKKQQAIALYRVHDTPNEDRLTSFRQFLKELGLTLDGESRPLPKDFVHLMQQTRQRPDNELIQTLLLRSLQPALYTPDNRGHFGLALPAYAHFTSPIRRYPDLLLHRIIKALLKKTDSITEQSTESLKTPLAILSLEDWSHLGSHCSMTERRADEATREVADWLKCEFMQEHVGMQFRGVIAGVTSFGFFVRLEKLFIDGLVHVSTLDNDYYQFDSIGQRLTGQSLGISYRLGDVVQVTVAAVNLEQRKIDFALIHSERSKARTKQPKTAAPLSAQKTNQSSKQPRKRAKKAETSQETLDKPSKPHRSRQRRSTQSVK